MRAGVNGCLTCTVRAAHSLTTVAPSVTPFCRQRDKQEAFYVSEMFIERLMNRCKIIFSEGQACFITGRISEEQITKVRILNRKWATVKLGDTLAFFRETML